jgi:hypothetical protein
MPTYVITTFTILHIIILLLSLYFFVDVVILKKTTYNSIFSTWQFAMLLALYVDYIYIKPL